MCMSKVEFLFNIHKCIDSNIFLLSNSQLIKCVTYCQFSKTSGIVRIDLGSKSSDANDIVDWFRSMVGEEW